MTLTLNNRLVQGQEIRVGIRLPFGDADLSGSGSGTETAEEGVKAKEMMVSLYVPFERPDWLADLTAMAERVDDNGRRAVYRIGHDAADAMKFYQGKFFGELNVDEQDNLQVWRVGFTIKEQLSVPERKEQRETLTAANQQTMGESGAEQDESDDIPPSTQLTGFERMLQYADNMLSGLGGDE